MAVTDARLVATSYEIIDERYQRLGAADVQIVRRRTDPDRWALVRLAYVFSKAEHGFVYEPQPSSRTAEFLADTRFESPEAALSVFERWLDAHLADPRCRIIRTPILSSNDSDW